MTRLPDDWPNRDVSRFVRIGPVEWHVQTIGTGPVALLLHGTGASTHSWAPLMPLLAEKFTVVAVDLPGHGFTRGRPTGGLAVNAIAPGIAALMTQLGLAPEIVVGHSAGAAVAVRLASGGGLHPQAIVGIGAALLPFPGLARQLFPAMAKMLFVNPIAPLIVAGLASRPGAVADVLPRLTGSRIAPAGVAHYATLFARSEHVAGAIGMMAGWDLEPVKAALPTLGVPMLLIHGEGDATIPLAAARETAALANARLEVMPGGHLVHEEHAEQVAALILAFTTDVATTSGMNQNV